MSTTNLFFIVIFFYCYFLYTAPCPIVFSHLLFSPFALWFASPDKTWVTVELFSYYTRVTVLIVSFNTLFATWFSYVVCFVNQCSSFLLFVSIPVAFLAFQYLKAFFITFFQFLSTSLFPSLLVKHRPSLYFFYSLPCPFFCLSLPPSRVSSFLSQTCFITSSCPSQHTTEEFPRKFLCPTPNSFLSSSFPHTTPRFFLLIPSPSPTTSFLSPCSSIRFRHTRFCSPLFFLLLFTLLLLFQSLFFYSLSSHLSFRSLFSSLSLVYTFFPSYSSSNFSISF